MNKYLRQFLEKNTTLSEQELLEKAKLGSIRTLQNTL